MTKIKHILGLSGGKDSAALAVHMNNRHPDIDVEYFLQTQVMNCKRLMIF